MYMELIYDIQLILMQILEKIPLSFHATIAVVVNIHEFAIEIIHDMHERWKQCNFMKYDDQLYKVCKL